MQNSVTNDNLGCFLPLLTTVAGSCLTGANWQEAGVDVASCQLASLLLKPGYVFLKQLANLGAYCDWPQRIALNASMPASKEGVYTLRSPYDGSKIRPTVDEILELVAHLQPQLVILPADVLQLNATSWKTLPDSVLPFFAAEALPPSSEPRAYGVYFNYQPTTSLASFMQAVSPYLHCPIYVAGDLSLASMQALINLGVGYVESDCPAADACQGHVYSGGGVMPLQDTDYATQFTVIDEDCRCPTCSQQFTRAYLHHLLHHTPLLCQRFLIQHNVYFTRSLIGKMKLRLSSFTPA